MIAFLTFIRSPRAWLDRRIDARADARIALDRRLIWEEKKAAEDPQARAIMQSYDPIWNAREAAREAERAALR